MMRRNQVVPRCLFWAVMAAICYFSSCSKKAPLTLEQNLMIVPGDLPGSAEGLFSRINQDTRARTQVLEIEAVEGTLNWGQSVVSQDADQFTGLIPFRSPYLKTVKFIAVRAGASGINFQLYRRSEASDHNQSGRLFRFLDLTSYGHTDTIGTSLRLRASGASTASRQNTASRLVPIVTCYEWMSCTGNGNGGCVGNIYFHTECITDIIWIDDTGGGGGGGSGPTRPILGGGSKPTPSTLESAVVPIASIQDYLGCLDLNLPARLTVYVDQPTPGSNEPVSILGGIGHAFVTIEQTTPAGEIRRTVGFHPSVPVNPFGKKSAPSSLGDDSERKWDVKLEASVTAQQLSSAVDVMTYANPTYNIEKYNCADFVIDVGRAAGIDIPRTSGWWLTGRGSNPGELGQDLRNMKTAVTGSGYGPPNAGSCK